MNPTPMSLPAGTIELGAPSTAGVSETLPSGTLCSWAIPTPAPGDVPPGSTVVTRLAWNWVEMDAAAACAKRNALVSVMLGDLSNVPVLEVCDVPEAWPPTPALTVNNSAVVVLAEVWDDDTAWGFSLDYDVEVIAPTGEPSPSAWPTPEASASPGSSVWPSASAAPSYDPYASPWPSMSPWPSPSSTFPSFDPAASPLPTASATASTGASGSAMPSTGASISATASGSATASTGASASASASASATSSATSAGETSYSVSATHTQWRTSYPPSYSQSASPSPFSSPNDPWEPSSSASPSASSSTTHTASPPSDAPWEPSSSATRTASAAMSPSASATPSATPSALASCSPAGAVPTLPPPTPGGALMTAAVHLRGTYAWSNLPADSIAPGAHAEMTAALGVEAYRLTGFVFIPGNPGRGIANNLRLQVVAPVDPAHEPTAAAVATELYRQFMTPTAPLWQGAILSSLSRSYWELAWTAPAIPVLTPATLEFTAPYTPPTTPRSPTQQGLFVSNAGSAALTVTAVSLVVVTSGGYSSSFFSLVSLPAFPATVAPGDSLRIAVQCDLSALPAGAVAPAFAIVNVAHNVPTGPHAVGVTFAITDIPSPSPAPPLPPNGGDDSLPDMAASPAFKLGAAVGLGAVVAAAVAIITSYCCCCSRRRCCCKGKGKGKGAGTGGASVSSSSGSGSGSGGKKGDSGIKKGDSGSHEGNVAPGGALGSDSDSDDEEAARRRRRRVDGKDGGGGSGIELSSTKGGSEEKASLSAAAAGSSVATGSVVLTSGVAPQAAASLGSGGSLTFSGLTLGGSASAPSGGGSGGSSGGSVAPLAATVSSGSGGGGGSGGEAGSSGRAGAPSIVLKARPTLRAAEFESRWAALSTVELYGATLAAPLDDGALQRVLATAGIVCIASGTVSGVSKFYFYAQEEGSGKLCMAEVSVALATRRLTAVIKAADADIGPAFVNVFKRSVAGMVAHPDA